MSGLGFQRPLAQAAYNIGQVASKAMPYALATGAGVTGLAAGVMGANMMQNNSGPTDMNDPYAAQKSQQYAAYKQGLDEVANQPGVMTGSELIGAQQQQDNYLRNQRRLDRADQWEDMQKASYLTQNLRRDQAAQQHAQQMNILGFQTKADQAKDLLQNYAQGRRDAMNFAQQSFRSLV